MERAVLPIDKVLVETMMRVSRYWAWRTGYSDAVVDVEDLVQIGLLGGLKAVDRWEPGKGKFITFITPYVRGAILEYIRRARACRRQKGGGVFLGTSRFSEIVAEGADMDDLLPGTLDADSALEVEEELEAIKARRHISDRDWLVLVCRYGEGRSQKEAGEALGLTGAMISVIEKNLRERLGIRRLRRQKVGA